MPEPAADARRAAGRRRGAAPVEPRREDEGEHGGRRTHPHRTAASPPRPATPPAPMQDESPAHRRCPLLADDVWSVLEPRPRMPPLQ